MNAESPDKIAQAYAAYQLGRGRFTVRMWQELAWTWDPYDEAVIDSVDLSLDDLLNCVDQGAGVIDPLAAIDIQVWIERFRQRWTAYCGSEEHIHATGEGIVVPTDEQLARNPFHHDLQDLLRITDRDDLLPPVGTDMRRWFKVGSIIGRCEYLMWAGSSVADDALALLGRDGDVPAEIRREAQRISSLAPALQLSALLKLHQALVAQIGGDGGDKVDLKDYVLVIVGEKQSTIYFEGTRISTQLDPYEIRLLRAYAERPGQPLARTFRSHRGRKRHVAGGKTAIFGNCRVLNVDRIRNYGFAFERDC